ncbi:MAG: HlyD family efflux transporter periplasmic adaptor subunit, partial [Acidobacteria bacterium]|nr:HlyD family efflux transporter periplasmic adaptor subunit [Acidobacteriota bacterium]
MKKLIARLILLIVVAAVVAGGYYLVQQLPGDQAVDELALVEVKRGDLTVATHLRGELRAVRSLTLTAPNLGSQSQVIQLAPPGSLAQRGDLIVELDDSERVAALEDDLLSVDKIQEQLKQAETELEIRKTQDEVEIVKADFQVRRYELEVRRNELLSSIDARKNELSLEEAKARKTKLEEDIKNRLTQREAELAVLREQLKKAELDVDRERRRIEQARVLAPISGLVSILENRSGGRGGFGTTTPTIREGDQIPAGISVAQLLDLSEMELIAKVEEVERANLREGQEAVIRLDALPGREIKGTVKRLGTTASMNVFRGEATKKFDAILGIDMRQLLQNVGAKPEQIDRIMATARVNAAQGFGAARQRPAAGPGIPGGPGAPPQKDSLRTRRV